MHCVFINFLCYIRGALQQTESFGCRLRTLFFFPLPQSFLNHFNFDRRRHLFLGHSRSNFDTDCITSSGVVRTRIACLLPILTTARTSFDYMVNYSFWRLTACSSYDTTRNRTSISTRSTHIQQYLLEFALWSHWQVIRKFLERFKLVQPAVPIVEDFVEFDNFLCQFIGNSQSFLA